MYTPMQHAASATTLAVTATVGRLVVPTKINDEQARYVHVACDVDPVFLLPGDSAVTLAAASVAATEDFTFTGVPADGGTLTINGVVFTFKDTPVAVTDIDRKTTATTQADETVLVLNASTNPLVALATYSNVAGVVTVLYDGHGTRGNAFTLAESATLLTVGGATLSGGVNGGMLLTVGMDVMLNVAGQSHIAAICAATNTSTLSVTPLENQ